MIGQAWQLPSPHPFTQDSHPYGTANFRNETTHWQRIQRSELLKGDALVYNDGSHGHIVMFDKWAANGQAEVYECAGCAIGCVHRAKSIASQYVAIRRNLVQASCTDSTPGKQNTPPKAIVKSGTASNIVGTAVDPDAPTQSLHLLATFDEPAENTSTNKSTVGTTNAADGSFDIALPSDLLDGNNHTAYLYAFDATDPSIWTLAVGSPVTFGTSSLQQTCNSLAAATPPAGWTCDAQQWGDCKCDCNCGAVDPDCTPMQCSGCDHDVCTIGAALAPTCTLDGQNGACIAAICQNDQYCCETGPQPSGWTISCVAHIWNGDFGCAPSTCPAP
jgi:hypothetical protein